MRTNRIMKANHFKILSMPVAVTSYEDSAQRILSAARNEESKYVCVANVHMCMETFDCCKFRTVVSNANLVVPDGIPLVIGLKRLGMTNAKQVRGSDLLLKVCKEAEIQDVPIGLYGGTPESLFDFLFFLKNEFPNLEVPFFSSPPFRELNQTEKDAYVKEINSSGARILFVGIGCPKQEIWMAEHRGRVNCVMIGVGAAFDFFSGRKKHAPRWIQKSGFEWLFRLVDDPKRLWKRYLKHNPRFMYHFGKQHIWHILSMKK
ncbi:WecB/TagA/CpsF family glycosyltransferase [Thermodesulfobacteriota bacterium]